MLNFPFNTWLREIGYEKRQRTSWYRSAVTKDEWTRVAMLSWNSPCFHMWVSNKRRHLKGVQNPNLGESHRHPIRRIRIPRVRTLRCRIYDLGRRHLLQRPDPPLLDLETKDEEEKVPNLRSREREREVKGLDLKDLEWGRKDGFFAAIFSTEAKSMRGENKNTRSARIAVAEDGLLDSGHGVPEMKDGDRIPA